MAKLYSSFRFALLGVFNALRYERNFRLMWMSAILVCFFNSIFTFSEIEQLWFIAAISLVLVSELFNSSIEKLCNLYSKKNNLLIKTIKDFSSAAVLIISLGSFILFLIISGKNFYIIKPWLFSLSSLDFILLFLFTFHQGIKGVSSFIDVISSVITLIFMVGEFHNIFWALSGILAFVIWQIALILNAMDNNAFRFNFKKNRPSL